MEPLKECPVPRATPRPARKERFTEDLVRALRPEAKPFYVWDTKNRGLGIRVSTRVRIAFVLKVPKGKMGSKWITMKAKTLPAAVIEYHDLLSKFGRGETLPARQVEDLWQDVVDRFEKEHFRTKLKESTKAGYRSVFNILRAAFKDRPIRSITHTDLWDMHEANGHRTRQANIAIMLAKVIFSRCRKVWGIIPREMINPVEALQEAGWEPYPEEARDVRLNDDQLQKIGTALAAMEGKESAYPIAAIRLLFFTGCRLHEVLDLKWNQVDLEDRNLIIQHHKTEGKVGTLKKPLNDAALEVLEALPRMTYVDSEGKEVEHPYVLPGAEMGNPIRDLRKFWHRVLKLAGLESVKKESGDVTTLHLHDIRHAHGNAAADEDLNLQTIAALLGHSDPHTTARYSKTGQNRALAASQQVSGSLKAKMGRRT